MFVTQGAPVLTSVSSLAERAPAQSWVERAIAGVMRACYRPRIVRTLLLPCHIGMCIPSAGTALGIYASKFWVLLAATLLGH